jgi:hypothetical protein
MGDALLLEGGGELIFLGFGIMLGGPLYMMLRALYDMSPIGPWKGPQPYDRPVALMFIAVGFFVLMGGVI